MQFKRPTELKRTRIEIIPMIDTVLFMLIFFILASFSMVKFRGINVNLPSANTATSQSAPQITISVNKHKNVFLDGRSLPISDLSKALLHVVANRPGVADQIVTIDADQDVPQGVVVRCIDEAKNAGIGKFVLAVSSGDSSVSE